MCDLRFFEVKDIANVVVIFVPALENPTLFGGVGGPCCTLALFHLLVSGHGALTMATVLIKHGVSVYPLSVEGNVVVNLRLRKVKRRYAFSVCIPALEGVVPFIRKFRLRGIPAPLHGLRIGWCTIAGDKCHGKATGRQVQQEDIVARVRLPIQCNYAVLTQFIACLRHQINPNFVVLFVKGSRCNRSIPLVRIANLMNACRNPLLGRNKLKSTNSLTVFVALGGQFYFVQDGLCQLRQFLTAVAASHRGIIALRRMNMPAFPAAELAHAILEIAIYELSNLLPTSVAVHFMMVVHIRLIRHLVSSVALLRRRANGQGQQQRQNQQQTQNTSFHKKLPPYPFSKHYK